MLNLALDAMKRADGIDRQTKRALPPGYAHSSFNIAALTAIGPHIKTVFGMGVVIWMFIGFALSFAIKVPMFPFHTWLPDAHYDAPTAGSVILAGVLLKMGTYGFMRFSLPIFSDAAKDPTVRQVMVVLSIIGIIYGALVAMAQKDVKKLVAYSSVSHLGLCDARVVCVQSERNQRRGDADDQSRHLDRRAVHAWRHSVRAPSHL